MRKAYLLLILLPCLTVSQNKELLYGFADIPQSLLLNPGGKVTNDWYVGIPLLSQIYIHGGTTGSTIYDLFAADGLDFNRKLEKALYSMNSNDYFSFNEQLDLFSGGFKIGPSYEKNKYISFGLYQEMDFIGYFPKDYAILAYEGNQSNINRVFNASDFNVSAELLTVFHVGYNKKVSKKVTYGFRGKIYSSMVNINSINNKGYFTTVNGTNNFYDHIFNLNLGVQTSGLSSLTDSNMDSDKAVKELKKRLFFGGSLGLGVDVGFTYQLTKQWMIDGSLQDIGFIRHSKDVENFEVKGDYVFKGINPLFPEAGTGQTANDYWNDIKKEFENVFVVDTTKTNYTTWRPVKLNASLNYAFGKKRSKECNCYFNEQGYQNSMGLQLFAVNRPKQPQLALTAYFYRKILKDLQAKVTYTLDPYSLSNIGFGVSTNLGNLNFYMLANNLLAYQNIYNAQSVSLQLGFNYIFKKNEN
tara:strand:+ start:5987 stop:7399 length:1413 start_codon:yes stop_codon:yes gene_type:complete